MSSPITAFRARTATVLVAVVVTVLSLLTAQAVTAPPAAAAGYPTVGSTPVTTDVLGEVDYGPSVAGTSCLDQGGPLRPVVGLDLYTGSSGRISNLGVDCAVPAAAPVAPVPAPVTRLFSGAPTTTLDTSTACPADQVVVGLAARLVNTDVDTRGDAFADLRLICSPLDRDGQPYAAVAQEWARNQIGQEPTPALCPARTLAYQVNGYADTDHVYGLSLTCTSPGYDPAVVAANLPHSDAQIVDDPLGGSANNYVDAGCGDGVVATGVNAAVESTENEPQLGAVGLQCTGFASGTAPVALGTTTTTVTTSPQDVDADPDTGGCPAGQVVAGLAARIVNEGGPDLVRGLIPYCADVLSDGTIDNLEPGRGPEVGTGTADGTVVGPVLCPQDQAVTGLQAGIVDIGYGDTPGQLLIRCSTFTFGAPAQAANSSWTTATVLGANSVTQQALTFPGAALWYKVPVQPSSTVQVDLTGLPDDLDLAVFGDIGQSFLALSDTEDLTRLSAEFAGVDVAPTTFSPTTFSPTTFSPTTFSPTTFSPTTFSPTTFSPTTFSPTTFSPTTFSPTTFSPTTFSPTTFSPEVTPDEYLRTGSFQDTAALAGAFSAAQTRSLLAVSARSGLSPETFSGDTYTRTGFYYLRVTARDGATSPVAPTLTVATTGGPCDVPLDTFLTTPTLAASPDTAGTVVLTDTGRFAGSSAAQVAALQQANRQLVSGAAAGGALAAIGPVAVVDVAGSPRVQALQAQADAHPGCPYAKNLVAQSIRDIVNGYRGPAKKLTYVVVEGSDAVVPFFRYADDADIAPESGYAPPVADGTASDASLRNDFVLGQDAYGAAYDLTIAGLPMPVPDVAVGRVVETPTEIAATLTAYVNGNGAAISPSSTLATGYDFLAAGAKQIASSFAAADTGGRNDVLLTNQGVDRTRTTVGGRPTADTTWTAADLRTAFFGSKHDVVYLAGHFSASAALAADFTTTVTTQEIVTAPAGNFRNTLVFSAGCHSGYNLVDADGVAGVTDPLDWAQALAQQGATLVAGTGYQYGDTDFVKYSNQLYVGLAAALRQGTGAVAVGAALVRAKRDYLAGQVTIDGIDQKSLLQATVFGLPMQGVDFRTGRTPAPQPATPVAATPVADQPATTFGLQRSDVTVTPTLTTNTVPLTSTGGGTVTATYLAGPNGAVEVTPAAPALPVVQTNATPPAGTVLRGVGFRSGTYTDTPGITPLTGAPATETNTVHGPFVSDVFFPSRLATPNYFDALGGGTGTGATRLSVTPAQYRSDAPGSLTTVQRTYAALGYSLYYSGPYTTAGGNQPTAAAAPTFTNVTGSTYGDDTVYLDAQVIGDPSAGISSTWVTWTVPPANGGTGTWQSVDLTQDDTDSTSWYGAFTLPEGAQASDVRFLVQAVNGVGVVGTDDALGAYHRVDSGAPDAGPTTLVLDPVRSTSVAGSSLPVGATLTDGSGAPVVGKAVTFSAGGSSLVAVTGPGGRATASLPLTAAPGDVTVTASFAGDSGAAASASGTSRVTVSRRATALAVTPTAGGFAVALSDTSGTARVGIPNRTVFVVAADAARKVLAVRPVVLDAQGRGVVAPSAVPAGTRTLTAWFGSPATPTVGGTTFDQVDPLFLPVTSAAFDLQPTSLTVAPTAASTAAGTPVTFGATAVYGTGATAVSLPVTAAAAFTVGPVAGAGGSATGAGCAASACSATKVGRYTVTATYLGRTATATLTVTAAPLATVVASPATATVAAGVVQQYTVTGSDAYGNPLPAATPTLTIAPVTGGSSSGATCASGGCSAQIAGTYRVTASGGGKTATATLVVTAGPVAALAAGAGDRQTTTAGTAFGTALTAVARDAYGNPVAGVRVTFTVPAPTATTGGATFAAGALTATAVSDASGTATAPRLTAGSQTGQLVVTASAPGNPAPAPATFTVAVTAGGTPRADLSTSVSAPGSVKAGAAMTVTVTVRNAGPSAATRVGATLFVPWGATVTGTGAGGRVGGKQFAVFSVASLAAGATVTFTATVTTSTTPQSLLLAAGALSGTVDPNYRDNVAATFTKTTR